MNGESSDVHLDDRFDELVRCESARTRQSELALSSYVVERENPKIALMQDFAAAFATISCTSAS